MEIVKGSKVKVYCEGGLVEVGTVLEYTEKKLELLLIDNSVTIIINPNKRVIAFRVSNQEIESSNPSDVFVDVELKPERYFEDETERAASLAELRKELAHEERKRATEHINRSEVTELREVTFGLPDLTRPIPKHPKKK